jgi:hypothetical protein
MRLAVGVRGADPVFVTVVVHFQVVCHLFTAFAITEHSHFWRMVKLEKFQFGSNPVFCEENGETASIGPYSPKYRFKFKNFSSGLPHEYRRPPGLTEA